MEDGSCYYCDDVDTIDKLSTGTLCSKSYFNEDTS